MVLFRIADHVEQGLALMISQYRGRPLFRAWVASYLRQVQCLEDAAYNVILSRLIDRATGVHLDMIGKLVGEARSTRGDTDYRFFIAARIRINRSFGHWQDLYDVYNIVCSAPKLLTYISPANLLCEITDVPNVPPAELFTMLSATRAAGIGLTLIAATAPPATQFRWGDEGCETVYSRQGFGDELLQTSGGRVSDSYC